MHEMSIVDSILESVRIEARRFPGRHIRTVGVRIGELAGVDPEAMQFCFEALVAGTDLEPLALDIDYRPRQLHCRACECCFAFRIEGAQCPRCGATDSDCIGGDELELAYLEVEDGTCAART